MDSPRDCKEITIKIGWGRLAGKAWGPDNGRKVLALHGWLDNASTFDRLVPLLPPSWNVVSLDLAGHGHSDHRPPGVTYHFIDAVPDCFAVMDALGWKSASLLGHSLGGGVASLMAGAWPERIEKACFIEALGPLTAEAAELPERVRNFMKEAELLRAKRLPLYATEADAIEARLKVGGLSRLAAETLVRRGLKPDAGGFTWRTDPRLRLPSPMRLTEDQVDAFLKRLEAPALLIRGSDGMPFGEAIWKRRTALVPRLSIATVQGGHHVHLDAPELVAPILTAFLSS